MHIYSQSTPCAVLGVHWQREKKADWIAYLSALNCIAMKQQHFYILTLNNYKSIHEVFVLALLLQNTWTKWKHIHLLHIHIYMCVCNVHMYKKIKVWHLCVVHAIVCMDKRKSHLTTSTSERSESRKVFTRQS